MIVEPDRNEATITPGVKFAPVRDLSKDDEYVPYQPALDAGISEEMDRVNFHRIQLINRKYSGHLTREEESELERLQDTFCAYLETILPRPSILDDDRLEKLERKYGISHDL